MGRHLAAHDHSDFNCQTVLSTLTPYVAAKKKKKKSIYAKIATIVLMIVANCVTGHDSVLLLTQSEHN